MMETPELSTWGIVALALIAACALGHGEQSTAVRSMACRYPMSPTQALPQPADGNPANVDRGFATADGIRATAKVCIYCTGVAPADGRIFATVYVTIDPTVDVRDLRFAALELVDAQGTTVAYGLTPDYIGVVTAAHADVGPFSGRIARGLHTILWMGSELEVIDHGLQPLPVHYRLHMVAYGSGFAVEGALQPPGATG